METEPVECVPDCPPESEPLIPPGPINQPAEVDATATPVYEISPQPYPNVPLDEAPVAVVGAPTLPVTGPSPYASTISVIGLAVVMLGTLAVRVARQPRA